MFMFLHNSITNEVDHGVMNYEINDNGRVSTVFRSMIKNCIEDESKRNSIIAIEGMNGNILCEV